MPPKKTRVTSRKPGRAWQFLIDNFSINEDTIVCLSGHVLQLYHEFDKSVLKTVRAVNSKFDFEPGYGQVDSLVKRASLQFAQFQRPANRESLGKICNEVFVVRYPPALKPAPPASSLSGQSEPSVVPALPDPSAVHAAPALHEPASAPASPALHEPPSCSFSTPRSTGPAVGCYTDPGLLTSLNFPQRLARLRGDQLTPKKQAMKRRLSFLSNEFASQRKRHRSDLKVLREKVKSRPYKFKQQNQAIARKQKTITQLRTTLKGQPANIELKKLRLENHGWRLKLATAKRKLDSNQAEHQTIFRRQLDDKNAEIKALQNDIMILEEQVEELQGREQTTRGGKVYSTDIRTLIFDMLVCHVPTRSVPPLLERIADFTGIKFSNIPHRTTVEQMARELGIISDLQTAETAISTKNLTLGFDATTQEGVHINAVHLTTETACRVVAIDQLAGGTSDDYESHITQSVDHLAKVYSDFHQQQFTDVRSTIISNISNTMSDRATVNHATITKVNALWQKSLNELNCHLHPLDTMASACRAALKGLETSKGKLYGKDCIAANIVLQLNKLRYKDGKGDPKGFAIFLDDHNLPRGLLPRYRGNRLHILFHTCGILIHHYSVLRNFLSSGRVSCGGLRNSLFQDFISETGILELCALGLLGKLLTGPWMSKFYAAADEGLDYLDGIQVVRDVYSTLAESAMDPLSLMDRQTNFFGGDLTQDPIFRSVVAYSPRSEEMRDLLTCCLDAVMSVIDRQYTRQFNMEQTEGLKAQTQTARLHNIDSEELMGMFSAAQKKAPNATLCYLSSKLRAGKNDSTGYLRQKPAGEKKKIMLWAISTARKKRLANRRRHEEMKVEMSRRVGVQMQKREDKERRKVEKTLKECTLEQVEELFPDLAKKEAADVGDLLAGAVIGRRLCHIWFDSNTNTHDMYYGRVVKAKKKKDMFVILYWKAKENEEEDAVEYDMNRYQLAADVVSGDLMLS